MDRHSSSANAHPETRQASAGFLFAVVLAALIAGNWNALSAMARIWMSEGHSAEILVLIIDVWLLWRVRHEIAGMRFCADWRGLLLVVPAGAGLLLAKLADIRAAQLTFLLIGISGVVWCVLGRAMLRIVAFPIAFLVLALPVWDVTKPVLQEMTVRTTAFVLEAVGVPLYVDQTYISIPSGTVLVLAECSGAQFFQAGVIVGALFAYLNFKNLPKRLAVIALFGSMVILGNWLRVLTLVFLGPQSELQHVGIGWGVFVTSIVPAFWLALRLRAYGDDLEPLPGEAVAPVQRLPLPSGSNVVWTGVFAMMLLVLLPLAADYYTRSLPEEAVRLKPVQPMSPWSGPYEAGDSWRPVFANADSETIATYRALGREVTLYAAYYASQDQRAEAVSGGNSVYDQEDWHPRGGKASGTVRQIALGDANRALKIVETRLNSAAGGSERLVWHWFRIAGRDVAVTWRAKLLQIVGLAQRRDDAMVIAISVVGSDLEDARSSLREFLKANFGELDAMTSEPGDTTAVRER